MSETHEGMHRHPHQQASYVSTSLAWITGHRNSVHPPGPGRCSGRHDDVAADAP
jgi:hypothetical protein